MPSNSTGQMVYSVRLQCGRMLARENGVDADIISSVPESGTAAAHGFAREVTCGFLIKNFIHLISLPCVGLV